MRDDFKADVKDILARRVGMKCSNPNCRRPTSGPQVDPNGSVNIGVAAHITAAAPNGPRYDEYMNGEERSSAANGIWLCQNCAKMIDSDTNKYTVDLLHEWRRHSERAANMEIENPSRNAIAGNISDLDIIRFYAQCFDRPAFQDHFYGERSMEDFDRAIEDTITAINTGCLRARDGGSLATSKGKVYLENTKWRARMDLIVDMLRAIRSRYEEAVRTGAIFARNYPERDSFYDFRDPGVAEWMDQTRNQVLQVFGQVCKEAGLPEPPLLRHRRFYR
ncbi:MAG: HNH endonuclease [Pseudomonadota bacterium]